MEEDEPEFQGPWSHIFIPPGPSIKGIKPLEHQITVRYKSIQNGNENTDTQTDSFVDGP